MNTKKNIREKYVYTSPWLKVREDQFEQDEKMRIYNVVERSNSVAVIPLTPQKKTILLKHYRYPIKEYSYEIPLGGVNEEENVEDAAKRELFEETKLDIKKLTHIGTFYPAPGLTDQHVDVFIVKVTDSSLEKAQFELNEDDIEGLSIVTLDELYKIIQKGEIKDGFTLSSLLLLKTYLESQQ